MSLKQVPVSVSVLGPTVDFFAELDNSPRNPEVKLATEGITWDEFRDNWAQACLWVPPEQDALGIIKEGVSAL